MFYWHISFVLHLINDNELDLAVSCTTLNSKLQLLSVAPSLHCSAVITGAADFIMLSPSRLLGVEKVMAYMLSEWLTDIRANQLPSILGGVGPMYSFVQLSKSLFFFSFFTLPSFPTLNLSFIELPWSDFKGFAPFSYQARMIKRGESV